MTIIRVLDFETCGLPPDNQIVEVATVDLIEVATGWSRGESWSSLVNPGRPIPPEASAVHHITDEMVKDAPKIGDLGITGEGLYAFAAHNAKFERACAPWLEGSRWICTYRCATSAWPNAPAFGNHALRYWLKLRFAQDPGPSHRAAGDAYVTAALLNQLLGMFPVETLVAVSAEPALLPRFAFGRFAGKPMAELPNDYLRWVVENIRDDEDVNFTARYTLDRRREKARNKSPV